jgi:hypothetical protein
MIVQLQKQQMKVKVELRETPDNPPRTQAAVLRILPHLLLPPLVSHKHRHVRVSR